MSGLISSLLVLALIGLGFRIMLRGVFGSPRGGYSARRSGPGYLHALLFSVLLPAVWWTLTILGRLYQRAYVVFTEFLTGVPDWVSYRTSAFKYLGATLAFLAYNVAIVLILFVTVGPAAGGAAPLGLLVLVALAEVCAGLGARACMRRAP